MVSFAREGADLPNNAPHYPLTASEPCPVKFKQATTSPGFDLPARGDICHSRHCRRQCKIFASGVNFSGNNVIYNINESAKYIFSGFHL